MDTDEVLDRGKSSDVSPWVRDAIILLLGIPPILVLWAIGVAAIGVGYRMARYGELPSISGAVSLADNQLLLIVAGAALLYLYLIWANTVFGTENVEASIEQGRELKEQIDEERDE